ncbi:MAG: hypothetical protein IJ785_06555 [Bacteroidales bacterium]|nr:hypothetical protein [Bacteroidales bacterium]
MKTFSKRVILLFVAVAITSLAGCKKDPVEKPVVPNGNDTTPTTETVSLVGTSWVGVVNDYYEQDGNRYPAEMTWSLDFTNETEGELFFELVVANRPQPSSTVAFTYTFDGHEGVMNAGQMGSTPFVYDSEAQTITATLNVRVQGSNVTMGGLTVFHPRE